MTDTTETGGTAPDSAKPAGTQGASGANATDAVATGAEAPTKDAMPASVPAQAATTVPPGAPMETVMSDSTALAVTALNGGPNLQPATTQSPAPNPLLSNEVPAEQTPGTDQMPAAATIPPTEASAAPTVPRSEIDLLTQVLGDAMDIGVTGLSLAATVPDAGGGKPAYVSVNLSFFGPAPAGTKIGSIGDVMATLSTALKDEALLGETMAVENGYTCEVAITRG